LTAALGAEIDVPSGRDLDAVARGVIDADGRWPAYRHGLGHGIGLATHELPSLSRSATDGTLPSPTVFSVEPGIYLADETGVRIEDLVQLDAGAGTLEFLTNFPRDVVVVAGSAPTAGRSPSATIRCHHRPLTARHRARWRRHRPQEPTTDMISTGELRKGVAIELDGELWQILDYHHIKMGRGSAQVRITLRNIKRGQTVERSFQAGTKWPRASMERRPVQFLYRDDDDFHFMDLDTYDQFHLTRDQIDDIAPYLKDGMQVDRTSYQGETIGVELPVTVDLLVADTEPGFAGDTQTGARKPAKTETGLVVQVPIFVETGDTIRVDTRTGEYQTRV
jgi:elongation factor P